MMSVVTFEIREGAENPAAFLTAARQASLPVRQFGESGGRLCGEISARNYPELARLARKNGILLRHTGKRGGSSQIRKWKKRLGFMTGSVMFLALLIFSQFFLWAIDVEPTEMVSRQQVLDVLDRHGIRLGIFLPAADLDQAAEYARTELSGLAFFALNRIGSRIQVAMTDGVQPPVPEDKEGICNIVAGKNGIVRSVEDYAGSQTVSPGQSVGKGQLLVSGIIENRDGKMLYVHARGKVLAETEESRTFVMPLINKEREYTGETMERNRIDLFGRKWPLFLAVPPDELYESETVMSELTWGSFRLPVGIERETLRFYREEEISRTAEEALAQLEIMADAYEQELRETAEVLGRERTASEENGKVQMKIVWKLVEDIAREQMIEDDRKENYE